jgi:Cu(I)/Ag(I) efflux system membrane fusion protein
MKIMQSGRALALPLLIAACGQTQQALPENRQAAEATSTAPQAGNFHSAAGELTAIEGEQITISHGPVESLGWPTMTMTFRSGSPEMLSKVRVGERVSFSFRQDDRGYTLTSLSKGG